MLLKYDQQGKVVVFNQGLLADPSSLHISAAIEVYFDLKPFMVYTYTYTPSILAGSEVGSFQKSKILTWNPHSGALIL